MATKRIAVVTGANRGIGLEITRQLATNGVMVVLTARDEKRGVEAVEILKASGLSNVVFHKLDVTDPSSITSFTNFIQTQFGKLDILVNNAAVLGIILDPKDLNGLKVGYDEVVGEKSGLLKKIVKQTYETSEHCLRTNYYGVKLVSEALIPLLQLSNSPRIVNVSSTLGKLQYISNEKAKEELGDADGLEEEKVEEVVKGFLEDVKEDLLETKGWPINCSAYIISKAALNAYTRLVAKKYPSIAINAVCPGYVATELNHNTGDLTLEEGAKGPVVVALLPDGGPSGQFFKEMEISAF